MLNVMYMPSKCLEFCHFYSVFLLFLLFCLCLELVLVGVLHQHSAIRLVSLGSKVDVVLDIENSALRIILGRLEIKHQVVLDSAGSIGLEVGVVAGVQLSSNTKVVIMSDHDVDVSRAVRMTAHDAEKLGRGTECIYTRINICQRRSVFYLVLNF